MDIIKCHADHEIRPFLGFETFVPKLSLRNKG